MAKFTNHSGGPKAVNTTTGAVILQDGETRDLDVSSAEVASMKRIGFLDGSPQEAPADLSPTSLAQLLIDDNSADQLREIAKTEGVDGLPGNATKAEVAEAIIAKRNA